MSNNTYLINEQLQEIIRQHSQRMKEVLEPLVKLQYSPTIMELQKSVERLTRVTDGIALRNQESFKRIVELNNHLGLKAFSERMQLISEQFTIELNNNYLFTPQLSKLVTNIDWESLINEDSLLELDWLHDSDLSDEIESKFNKENPWYSGKQFLYIAIITLILQVIATYASLHTHLNDTDKQILSESKQTNVILKRIEGFLAKTESNENSSNLYENLFLEVKKEGPLRLYPDSSSDSVLIVFSGQFLDVLDDTNYWYKVQFVNFENGDIGTGWIYKGNVEEIRGRE